MTPYIKHNIEDNIHIFLLFCLVVLALVIRLHNLDYESMWMDEIRQVSYYENDFSKIINNAAEQQQPPLDYWIGSLVYKLSKTDFSARLPSAVFGAATILLLVFIIKLNCSWQTAIFTGLILSILPFHIYYSQEARPYSIPIFLLLALLLSLYSILFRTRPTIIYYLLLLLITTLFLFSRTLSPLCIITVISFFLLSRICYIFFLNPKNKSELLRKYLYVIIIFTIAFCLYAPVFILLIYTSAPLTINAPGLDINFLINRVMDVSIIPIWQAYLTQLEPIGIILLVSVIGGAILSLNSQIRNKYNLLGVTVILLILTSAVHIFIFNTMTDFPFRAPYPIYILPLCLIISAIFFEIIFHYMGKYFSVNLNKTLISLFLAIILVYTIISTIDFKKSQIKTDWRELSELINQNLDNDNIIYLFDAISPYDKWKPNFYGSIRYPVNEINSITVPYFTSIASLFNSSQHKPVLILFNYRDYFLTSTSPYPIVPVPNGTEKIELNKLFKNSNIKINKLTGIWIISLKSNSDNFLYDSYLIFKSITNNIPINNSTLDIYLTTTSLAALCEQNKNIPINYLFKINNSTDLSAKDYIQSASEFIYQQINDKTTNPGNYCQLM